MTNYEDRRRAAEHTAIRTHAAGNLTARGTTNEIRFRPLNIIVDSHWVEFQFKRNILHSAD